MKDRKKYTLRIPEDIINRLFTFFSKHKTVNEVINIALKRYIQMREISTVEEPCDFLKYINGIWKCVWYRYNKPPLIKELGRDLRDVLEICDACKKGKKLDEESKLYKRLMADGITLQIPYCQKGGKISEDLKQFYCPDLTEWVKLTWCIKRERGGNCRWLRFVRIRKKLKDKEVY